MMIMND